MSEHKMPWDASNTVSEPSEPDTAKRAEREALLTELAAVASDFGLTDHEMREVHGLMVEEIARVRKLSGERYAARKAGGADDVGGVFKPGGVYATREREAFTAAAARREEEARMQQEAKAKAKEERVAALNAAIRTAPKEEASECFARPLAMPVTLCIPAEVAGSINKLVDTALDGLTGVKLHIYEPAPDLLRLKAAGLNGPLAYALLRWGAAIHLIVRSLSGAVDAVDGGAGGFEGVLGSMFGGKRARGAGPGFGATGAEALGTYVLEGRLGVLLQGGGEASIWAVGLASLFDAVGWLGMKNMLVGDAVERALHELGNGAGAALADKVRERVSKQKERWLTGLALAAARDATVSWGLVETGSPKRRAISSKPKQRQLEDAAIAKLGKEPLTQDEQNALDHM